MKPFAEIFARAAARKGGESTVRDQLPSGLRSAEELAALPEDRYLAEMTRAIFKAGFVWKVIEAKWPGFEEAFWGFDIDRCHGLSPDDEDALCRDERIIRNRQKILTVAQNAGLIAGLRPQYGSIGTFVADWPAEDYFGLLDYFRQHGARLGGLTCQYFLRSVGVDGFVLSRDGTWALIDAGVVDKPPSSKGDMRKVQQAYNLWREESGYGFAAISRILALSIDAPG